MADLLKLDISYFSNNLITLPHYKFFLLLTLFFFISCKVTEENKYPIAYDNCNENELEKLVGRNLGNLEFNNKVKTRIFKTGDNVTLDYLPNRINIEIDNSNIIKRAYCG